MQCDERDFPLGYFAVSLYGAFRSIVGVVGSSYLMFDDPELYDEILETFATLIALGGFIPCPDHRIPPGAKWNLVKYYAQRMQEEF